MFSFGLRVENEPEEPREKQPHEGAVRARCTQSQKHFSSKVFYTDPFDSIFLIIGFARAGGVSAIRYEVHCPARQY